MLKDYYTQSVRNTKRIIYTQHITNLCKMEYYIQTQYLTNSDPIFSSIYLFTVPIVTTQLSLSDHYRH